MLSSLDVRQMVGQPAWAGSTGFQGFAGIGQATPTTVAHELGHSYWGAFPVTGRPDLSWDIPSGESIAPAIAQYQNDLQIFMLQPPDRYEPLRERFRNLPNLSKGDFPDLFHIGESDIVSLVAGDLNLVAPILRKYYDQYLSPGQHQTWDDLLSWYLGLPAKQKPIADVYLGLAHIPKEAYRGLPYRPSSTTVPQEIQKIIRGEERQRLIDFADQFDLIVGNQGSFQDATGVDRGFPFWRSYLREMYGLHKRYPDFLSSLGRRGKAREIGLTFDILVQAEELVTEDQVQLLRERAGAEPFLYNFLPILKNRILVRLLDPQIGPPPPVAVQKGTGAFVEELRRFIGQVDRILEVGEVDPVVGARALEDYIESLKDQVKEKLEQDVDTIFEIFADTDKETTRRIMAQVRDTATRELLDINPARTRFLLEPQRLLDALNIRVDVPSMEAVQGIKVLLDNSSGNFEIDKPFTEEVYRRISERGRRSPQETLQIIKESKLPMPDFLFGHPEEAASILSSDLKQVLELVTGSGPLRVPPARLVYHLIYVDPRLAAR